MHKEPLLGKSLDEITEVVLSLGFPKFTAKQICDWIYKKRIKSISEMSNISEKNRNILGEKYSIGSTQAIDSQLSTDGTQKFLFATHNPINSDEPKSIESVFIPGKNRGTICISSQCGCKMNCSFCATATQGFSHNLEVSEILNQFYSIPQTFEVSNIVFMGMGEPFDNTQNVLKVLEILCAPWGFALSPKRITVSTVGLFPGLKQFLDESQCHVAISLHTPFEDERNSIIPTNKAYSINAIVECLKNYDWTHQRRLSFEYILLANVNDSLKHAYALHRLLYGMECRINLISYHKIDDKEYKKSSPEATLAFRDYLTKNGIFCSIRQSRGEDILAACGLLALTKGANSSNDDYDDELSE